MIQFLKWRDSLGGNFTPIRKVSSVVSGPWAPTLLPPCPADEAVVVGMETPAGQLVPTADCAILGGAVSSAPCKIPVRVAGFVAADGSVGLAPIPAGTKGDGLACVVWRPDLLVKPDYPRLEDVHLRFGGDGLLIGVNVKWVTPRPSMLSHLRKEWQKGIGLHVGVLLDQNLLRQVRMWLGAAAYLPVWLTDRAKDTWVPLLATGMDETNLPSPPATITCVFECFLSAHVFLPQPPLPWELSLEGAVEISQE